LVAALTRSGIPQRVLFDGISEEEFGDILVTAGNEGLVMMMPPRLA
jgi:hypothetical protein